MSTTQLHTVADLLATDDPDRYELIDGELFYVAPASFDSSVIAARILTAMSVFVDQHDLGYVTGADGGFYLEVDPDTLVAPDVAFVRGDRFGDDYPHRGFARLTPDLAVEVRSPNDEPRHIRAKQALYDRTGVPLVWWVDPKAQTVTIRQTGKEPVVIDRTGILDGGDVLPGFQLAVSRIFKD